MPGVVGDGQHGDVPVAQVPAPELLERLFARRIRGDHRGYRGHHASRRLLRVPQQLCGHLATVLRQAGHHPGGDLRRHFAEQLGPVVIGQVEQQLGGPALAELVEEFGLVGDIKVLEHLGCPVLVQEPEQDSLVGRPQAGHLFGDLDGGQLAESGLQIDDVHRRPTAGTSRRCRASTTATR